MPSSLRRLDTLRAKARVYASDDVRRLLGDVTAAPPLALCIDVDALERTYLARIDGVMLLALQALCERLPVALLAWDANERAAILSAALPTAVRCTHTAPHRSLAPVRAALPGRRLVVLTDAPDLVADRESADRALLLGALPHLGQRNIARIRDLEVRATLWWLAEHVVQSTETLKASSRKEFR
ncbi:MAG: hypothetical protein JNL83_14350 [Myxococcales bacterium]|nr:hypothetical protein [Myxococcales bacterium]